MSDTGSSGAAARTQSDDRTLAFVVYTLLFISPFVFGLTALIGVVIAYVRKPEADPLLRAHYRFQIQAFWIGFALAMIAAVTLMIGLGLLFWELASAFAADMPADPWDAVATDMDVTFPVAAFVAVIVSACAWLATSAWLLLSSVVGAVRLSGDAPMGRMDRS